MKIFRKGSPFSHEVSVTELHLQPTLPSSKSGDGEFLCAGVGGNYTSKLILKCQSLK